MDDIRTVSSRKDAAEAAALLSDHVHWLRSSGVDLLAEQPRLAAVLERLWAGQLDTGASLFLATAGDVAVGTVGVASHPDGTAELKHLYVRPIARGRGVAGGLVERAVREACERRCASLWLETLPGLMDAAIALYRRQGFARTDRPSKLHVPGIWVMELPLATAARCA